MASTKVLTLKAVIEQAFPTGYLTYPQFVAALDSETPFRKSSRPNFESPPALAIDLFAITGQLLLKSGAYHHVSPEVVDASVSDMLVVTASERAKWVEIGAAWRGTAGAVLPPPPPELVEHWSALMSFSTQRIFRLPGFATTARQWWTHALALFCIADEAALDIGFRGARPRSAQAEFIDLWILQRYIDAAEEGRKVQVTTFSQAPIPDVLAVLPKSRTANVGCTLRSLSHNLALLPGRGQARAVWSLSQGEPEADVGFTPFNVVVLPIPFAIKAGAFKGTPAPDASWGWFHVEPHWCPRSTADGMPPDKVEELYKFIVDALDVAAEDAKVVHALVLPECALSYDVFRGLCDRLSGRPGFELLISGLFDAPAPRNRGIREGNFAAMARFFEEGEGTAYDFAIREKHHRWRIERSQIETYALGSSLDVNRGWWERISILSRSLDVFVVRGTATVTTLICEDLARNDPVQELVRSIGPNFVVALLMDGPQLEKRWPARYATVLADDPGSSVLSVTSLGLIERTNQAGMFDPADQIALFRDDRGKATEIRLPKGAHGVCLSLQPSKLTEHTLDGRSDQGDAQSWRLAGVQPIRLANPNKAIMRGNWPD